MKFLVGSYKENIYEVLIDKENDKFVSKNIIYNVIKPSYLMAYNNLSFLHTKNNQQYLRVGDQDILLNEFACHISYDNKNNLIYTSHYHDGLLKIIDSNNLKIINTIKYEPHSHIHYAEFIDTINLLGVCDLGDDKFYLYDVVDHNINLKTYYQFENKTGPRHFVYHHSLPIIYVINELNASVTILKYENNKLIKLDEISLIDGAGSAIRKTSDNKFLYVGIRNSNYIFGFEILKNGLLRLIQKVHTLGSHPRDFNIINNKYLVVANMHSNNLTLFTINNGRLKLADANFELSHGACIITLK